MPNSDRVMYRDYLDGGITIREKYMEYNLFYHLMPGDDDGEKFLRLPVRLFTEQLVNHKVTGTHLVRDIELGFRQVVPATEGKRVFIY